MPVVVAEYGVIQLVVHWNFAAHAEAVPTERNPCGAGHR